MRYFLKIVINNTTIGTQTIVVHVIESAVTFLSIPYGTRNMLVLVIGKIEFIIKIANHSFVIKSKNNKILKKRENIIGVITIVIKKMLLTHSQ